mgnify:CR=1 FL=1
MTTFDRFRRVPKNLAGVDDSWEQYIGMPLTSVPPPAGSPHASWADHFKAPLLEAMAATGIEVRQISQTEQYRAGVYREQVLLAMRERFAIDKVLDQYRTLEAVEAARQKSRMTTRRRVGGATSTNPASAKLLRRGHRAVLSRRGRGRRVAPLAMLLARDRRPAAAARYYLCSPGTSFACRAGCSGYGRSNPDRSDSASEMRGEGNSRRGRARAEHGR